MTTTIYICRTCRANREILPDDNCEGAQLLRQVSEQLTHSPIDGVEVRGINCLSQCESPVAVAFVAPEKFNFIVSSLQPEQDADAILDFARLHAETALGRVKSVDRPQAIRENLQGRIPPVGWEDSI